VGAFTQKAKRLSLLSACPQLVDAWPWQTSVMADFDVELFINAVCNRPVLWDKSLSIYKDRNEIAKGWVEVCNVVNQDFAASTSADQKKFGKWYFYLLIIY
jgi:hypothetical protein